jgi:hypothetical protein
MKFLAAVGPLRSPRTIQTGQPADERRQAIVGQPHSRGILDFRTISGAAAGKRTGRLWRLGKKIAQFLLRRVRIGHLGLYEIAQNVSYPFWEGRPVMSPAPNRHPADPKIPSRSSVGAENHRKQEVMSAARETTAEAP